MRVILTVAVRGDEDLIDAHIAYHLNVGIDHVLVSDLGAGIHTREVLEAYVREGAVTLLPDAGKRSQLAARARLRRTAVENGADWVIESDPDEFWWPRGPSVKEVLAPMPARYTAVQALVRPFVPRPGDGQFFADRMVVRRALLGEHVLPEPIGWALRPVYRVRGEAIVDMREESSVPLHSWYPIEVLRFPIRSADQARHLLEDRQRAPRSRIEQVEPADVDPAEWYTAIVVDDASLETQLTSGSLVVDERLRNVLHELRTESGSIRRFALPSERHPTFSLAAPSIVEDAVYAVECAAVGEVDLAGIDRHIRDLESRISFLEQRFSARVVRKLSRLLRADRA